MEKKLTFRLSNNHYMKKIYLLSLAIVSTLFSGVLAQNHNLRNCGTMEAHEHQLQTDPEMQKRLDNIEWQTENYIKGGGAAQKLNGTIITIPVVFHVVWNSTAQNVSDAALLAQLDVLNKDFRKLNADASLIPSIFAGVAADCEIQFCMAQRNPQGLASTGIVRRQTTTTAFSTNNNVKFTANGGSNAWDASRYLNIWVCNLSNGVLGYAQFPGGAAATDGVVVLFSTLPGGTSAPYNKGRTGTHEVGHWLNLRHIWGDATCGSDFVADTPPHNAANYGCPASGHRSTCTGTPVEMTMNYMDYTDDACMYMFSAGQRDRMNALFATGGTRASLLSSNGCTPVAPSTCGVPSGLNTTNITLTSATLNWAAVSGATSYNVRIRVVGATSWNNFTASSTSLGVTGLTAGTQYEFQVATVCSAGTGNFSASSTFTTTSSGPTYCASRGNSAADEWIDLVSFSGINRTSGSNGGYIFISSPSASVVRGRNYTLSYSAGFRSGYSARQYWKVFIDWNNNGLFTDAGETVVNRNSTSAATLSTTITVPSTAVLGTVRMRVSMKWNSTQTACETFSYGEVEDYNVIINSAREIEGFVPVSFNPFTVYPNPASESIKMHLPLEELEGGYMLQITDLAGRTMKTMQGDNLLDLTEAGISVDRLQPGLYILSGTIADRKVMQRFSVNK